MTYINNVEIRRVDEAIKLFKSVLIDTNIYEHYKHLNKYYRADDDWLKLLSTRYRKEEWIEFRLWLLIVIKNEIWELKLPAVYISNYKQTEK